MNRALEAGAREIAVFASATGPASSPPSSLPGGPSSRPRPDRRASEDTFTVRTWAGQLSPRFQGVPVTTGHGRRRTAEFTAEDQDLLSTLAPHAAVALDNATLFHAQEATLARLEHANTRINEHNTAIERDI